MQRIVLFRSLRHAYLRLMSQKPFDQPKQVAKKFVKDMRAYFAESNPIKCDEIAARQAWVLGQHVSGKQLRTNDVVDLFWAMKDFA